MRFRNKHAEALHPGDLFHILNDVMAFHTASVGLDHHFHAARQQMWVLTAYDLELNQPFDFTQPVIAKTAPYSFKRMYGYRQYTLNSRDGQTIGEAKGRFVLINTATEQLMVPDAELLKHFEATRSESVALPMFKPGKIPKQRPSFKQTVLVTPKHIDVNGHVNNAFYPDWAFSYLPDSHEWLKKKLFIHVQFKREVFEKETVELDYYTLKEGFDVVMRKGDTMVARVIMFIR